MKRKNGSTKAPKKTSAKTPAKAPAKAPPAARRTRPASAVITADPAPARGAPTPPPGFKAPKKRKRGGGAWSPTTQQVRDAADVVREIESPAYAEDFGKRAPDPIVLGGALTLAKNWSNELAATESWHAYVRAQYDVAWLATKPLIDKLTPEFRLAADDSAAIDRDYPQTGDFLNVRRVSAAKAVVTRAEKKKAAKKTTTP